MLYGILVGLIVPNVGFATEMEDLCSLDVENYIYVPETDTCIPRDPCSSDDADVRNTYCVQSDKNIPLEPDGYEAYAYSLDKAHCSFSTYKKSANDNIGTSDNTLVKISECTGQVVRKNKGDTYGYIVYNNLGPGEWISRFYYGDIKGQSMCSGQYGNDHGGQWGGNSKDWLATEETLKAAVGEKANCWCRVDGLYNIGIQRSSFSGSWVFFSNTTASECAGSCAYRCSGYILHNKSVRSALIFNK